MGKRLSCVKTAEPIKISFAQHVCMGPRNQVLDMGTYEAHLANTIK